LTGRAFGGIKGYHFTTGRQNWLRATPESPAGAGLDDFRLAQYGPPRHAFTARMKQLEQDSSLPDMDRLTGIDPVHAADMTLHELRNWFGHEFPADFATKLVRRMELAFARHARWRKRASRMEEPDFARTFFRRWLAELLFKERRDLFWQLPPGYRYGEPLWPTSTPPKLPKSKSATVKVLPKPPRVELVDIIRPVRKTLGQSCPFVHGAELLC